MCKTFVVEGHREIQFYIIFVKNYKCKLIYEGLCGGNLDKQYASVVTYLFHVACSCGDKAY